MLSNGVECRLQRNALAVLEPPTGNETVRRAFGVPTLLLYAIVQSFVSIALSLSARVSDKHVVILDVGCHHHQLLSAGLL